MAMRNKIPNVVLVMAERGRRRREKEGGEGETVGCGVVLRQKPVNK
ncbi:hypothetical protein Hanom_Chr02g00163351 [Helianthus anomalus]